MDKLHAKAVQAAQVYLDRKGYEVVDIDSDQFDIVAIDDEALVFCDVEAKVGDMPSETLEDGYRRSREAAAIAWLKDASEDMLNRRVRFDRIDLCVMGDTDNALLRHHINVLLDGCLQVA